jgi:hypothetical protein
MREFAMYILQHPTKSQWFDNKRNEFVNTIHNSQGLLTTIINDLENIQARDRCTQQEIDDVTNKIFLLCEIFSWIHSIFWCIRISSSDLVLI